MIRDRDCIYGAVVTRRTAVPWAFGDKPYCAGLTLAERLCRTADRIGPGGECLDHVIVLGEGTSAPDSEILRFATL